MISLIIIHICVYVEFGGIIFVAEVMEKSFLKQEESNMWQFHLFCFPLNIMIMSKNRWILHLGFIWTI